MIRQFKTPIGATIITMITLTSATLFLSGHAAAETAKKPIVTFESDVRLAIAEVVVRDRGGDLIMDLEKSDFEIREDGVEQDIAVFERVLTRGEEEMTTSGDAAASEEAIDRYRGRTLALVVDQVTTERNRLRRTWSAINEFIDKRARANDRIALFSFHYDLELLRGFTSDMERLKAELDDYEQRFRVGAYIYYPEDGGLRGSDRGQPSLDHFEGGAVKGYELSDQIYNALIGVANALKPIRGRKEVIFFSSGYSDHRVAPRDLGDLLRHALADARASLNVIDTSGILKTSSALGAAADFNFERESSLARLADLGEGQFKRNVSDIGSALTRLEKEFGGYYVIGYYPHQPQMRRDFHEIEVTVPDKKVKISATPGYSAKES